MYPEPGQVLHFSKDPTIRRFVPRSTATPRPEAYVWAVDCTKRLASSSDRLSATGRAGGSPFPRCCRRNR
ncbi:DUF6886 family protein [Nocardia sp. NPDC057440]|uniref:DUF6886 family protein n=1 Tax=Nocardia sp. NPDC057440 TaxID=3346134 RepID=UPI0036706007